MSYPPAQIGIAQKEICAAVITHMAQVRVRRSRATRRGSTRSNVRAPNSKTDSQTGVRWLDGVDAGDTAVLPAAVPLDDLRGDLHDGCQRSAALTHADARPPRGVPDAQPIEPETHHSGDMLRFIVPVEGRAREWSSEMVGKRRGQTRHGAIDSGVAKQSGCRTIPRRSRTGMKTSLKKAEAAGNRLSGCEGGASEVTEVR